MANNVLRFIPFLSNSRIADDVKWNTLFPRTHWECSKINTFFFVFGISIYSTGIELKCSATSVIIFVVVMNLLRSLRIAEPRTMNVLVFDVSTKFHLHVGTTKQTDCEFLIEIELQINCTFFTYITHSLWLHDNLLRTHSHQYSPIVEEF